MNMLRTIAALGVALTATPLMGAAPAAAHDQGPRCSFYSIDRDGDQRLTSKPCHHMPNVYDQPKAGFQLFFDFGRGAYFFDEDRGRDYRPGRNQNQDLVRLLTFFKRSQVEAGADRNVQKAEVLTRRQAERIDGPNDRRAIFDYGSNKQTRDTCRYLDRLN